MKKNKITIFGVIILVIFIVSIFIFKSQFNIKYQAIPRWSIGIVRYDSTFTLKKDNLGKIYSSLNIPLENSYFVADPSIIKRNDKYYLFFENGIITEDGWKGTIDCAVSEDLANWVYIGTVLNEEKTVAFPIIYEVNNKLYMTIDSSGLGNLVIYESEEFPDKWVRADTLLSGEWSDPYILYENDSFFLFASKRYNYEAHLFYSDNILGPYVEHSIRPMVENNKKYGRNAGKVFKYSNKLYRPVQDCTNMYGEKVRLMEILELSKSNYVEREISTSPVLFASDEGWNSKKNAYFKLHRNNR